MSNERHSLFSFFIAKNSLLIRNGFLALARNDNEVGSTSVLCHVTTKTTWNIYALQYSLCCHVDEDFNSFWLQSCL